MGGLGQFETTLSYLMLVWVPLSHSRLTKELVAVCTETLKTNSTPTKLVLRDCNIDHANAAELAGQLKENSTLTSLTLCDCAIDKVGADALATGLKENSTLTSLDLSHNAISNHNADALAKGLKENSSLTSLNLSNNCLLYTSPSPRDQRGSRMPSSA